MLYNQGVDLTKIQQLLGHRSALTTERYLGVKFEETRDAILMLYGAVKPSPECVGQPHFLCRVA
jgi:integrase